MNLRELIGYRDLSEIARRIGVRDEALAAYVAGCRMPHFKTQKRIAEVLDVPTAKVAAACAESCGAWEGGSVARTPPPVAPNPVAHSDLA